MSFDVRGKLHCMYIKLLVISIITNYLDEHLKNVYVYFLYWCFNALCTLKSGNINVLYSLLLFKVSKM